MGFVTPRVELVLQIEATRARHADVEHQTPGPVGKAGAHQFAGRRETGDVEADRFDEFLQGVANIFVIIDYKNQRTIRNDSWGAHLINSGRL